MIESYHTTIGGVLCALSVKMSAWHELFPRDSVGGPVKRAEFIMLEMRQGIEEVRAILKGAKDSKPNPRRASKFKSYAQGQEERASAARGLKKAATIGDELADPDRF